MFRVGDEVKIKYNHPRANTTGKVLEVRGSDYHISLLGNRGLSTGTMTISGYYLQAPDPHGGKVRCAACRRWVEPQYVRRLGSMRFCFGCYNLALRSAGARRG